MACVYMHKNKVNGKVYIGYTSMEPSKRWRNDGSGYTDRGQNYFCNAIKKYGWDNFEHIILFDNLSVEEAKQKEIEMIAVHKSNNALFGYNSTIGGDGAVVTEAARQHLSESHKGLHYPNRKTITLTDEHKKKLSVANKGKPTWNKGKKLKPLSQETKLKISLSKRGKKLTEEHKEKLRKKTGRVPVNAFPKGHIPYNKGKKMPPVKQETRDKLSKANKGKQPAKQTIAAAIQATSRPVICVETGIVYKSVAEAARQLNMKSPSNIGACCRCKRNTIGGYHWEYVSKDKLQ